MNTITRIARRPLFALPILAALALGAMVWIKGHAEVPPPAPVAAPPAANPTWGVADPLTRLLPIDAYTGPLGRPLALTAARGEVADQQLVLLAGAQSWSGVQITFTDLRGPRGAALPHTRLHWRRVGSVATRKPYYDTRYVGLWPDPLLPAAPFDVPARGRAFAWVDLSVPVDAPPGLYSGKIVVASRNAARLTVPLSLRVWGFTLPRQNHLPTSFGFQGQGHFPLDPNALFDDLLAHRITPENAVGDPKITPPAGQTGWDWTQYDRDVQRRLAQGMTSVRIWLPPPPPASARVWQAHLQQKNWLGLTHTYISDEPTAGQIAGVNDQLGQIKQAAPELRNLITARGFPDALSHVDIWCPNMIYFNADQARRQQTLGREVWWYPAYPTRHPLPNLWTDYPLLDCRVWPWLTWKYNLDGLLYWDVCCWQNTPDPLTTAPAFLGGDGAANGDGQLVYPGPGGRPLDSMRLEALRDGLQDYEVFCLLEAGAHELSAAHKAPALVTQAQALLAIAPGVVTSDTQYNPDPHALLAAREQMSRTVEQIVKTLGHPPQILARPRLHPEIPRLQFQAQAAQTKPH